MLPPLVYPLRWNVAQKLLFRFFFCYFLLYLFPFPLNIVPPGEYLESLYTQDFQQWLMPWVGRNILHLPYEITVFPNGSGDTTFNYVQVLVFFVVALVATLVWSLLARERYNHNKLLYWTVVGLRYYVAFTMFGYGFAKVFKTQFPFPGITRLMEPYGQSSPMGLAWTFMGYSTAYNYFTGLGEIIGGALLLFRRTTALGGIILLCVIGNIVAINFCFDVPVKLYSSHLLLMTAFILVAEGRRLVNVLLMNRAAPPLDITPALPNRRWRIAGYVLKALLISYMFYTNISNGFNAVKQYGDDAPKVPFYGLYNVEEFTVNGQPVPPLLTDTTRWRQVMVAGYHDFSTFTVRMTTDSLRRYVLQLDTTKRSAVLHPRFDTTQKSFFRYVKLAGKDLALRGKLEQDSVVARLRYVPEANFLLVNRGFHWINEYPLNR